MYKNNYTHMYNMCIYVHVHVHVHTCIHVYVYTLYMAVHV